MTQFIFANNVNTTLAAAVTSSSTTLTLASSNHLPSSIPSGSYLALTLNDAATRSVFEIVYATSVSGSTVTVIRGQEGTTAQNWQVGDYIYASNTAGILSSFAPVEGSTNNPFAVAPASSSAPQNAPQYRQMFQLLTPSASGNITLTALRTIIMPNTTSAITLTMQPGTIVGQECQIIGIPAGVTVQSNVSSGNPNFIFPDNTSNYSFVLSGYGTSQTLLWDGTNWHVRTFGQMVVGTPEAQNQAAPLSYLQANFAAIGGSSGQNFSANTLSASTGDFSGNVQVSGVLTAESGANFPVGLAASKGDFSGNVTAANAVSSSDAVVLGQFTNSLNGSNDTSIIQRPDGVIEQWFQINVTTGGSGTYSFTVNFPEAFSNDCTGAVVGFRSTVPVPGSCGWTGASNSQITIIVDTDAAQTVNISIAAIGI